MLQPKVLDNTTWLRRPLARRGGILSIHNFWQATSQNSGSLTLLIGVIRDSLNQRVVNGNFVPHKNNKDCGKTTHHVLANWLLQEIAAIAKCSNAGIKTSWQLRALRHEVLMSNTCKSGSPGADT